MDVRDGSIHYTQTPEEAEHLRKMFEPFLVPVDGNELTSKQREQKKVSLHDHRSPVGKQLTALRQVGRNEPCPCGSGKKFKFCCMNV